MCDSFSSQKRKLEELYTSLKQAGDAAKRATSPMSGRTRVASPQVNRAMQPNAPRVEPPRAPLALQSISGTQLDSLDSKCLIQKGG